MSENLYGLEWMNTPPLFAVPWYFFYEHWKPVIVRFCDKGQQQEPGLRRIVPDQVT